MKGSVWYHGAPLCQWVVKQHFFVETGNLAMIEVVRLVSTVGDGERYCTSAYLRRSFTRVDK